MGPTGTLGTLATIPKEVYVAVIAAAASLLAAVISAILTVRSQRLQRDIEHLRFTMQKQLDEYKAEQQKALAETNALTSYRFEARKRLYTECEPIFFQLIEAADFALRKSRDLANPRTWEQLRAEKTNLERGSTDWMLNKSSDLIVTFYALYAPLALYLILRSKLTSIDCTVDQSILFRFRLARQLYGTFLDDVVLASYSPALEYDPLVSGWRQKRLENPSVYWWQGLTPGRLDRAVRKFIVREDSTPRIITFGEFEDLYLETYETGDPEYKKILGVAANALYNFTPYDRPVFWRIIMVQVHLHNALCRPVPNNIADIMKSSSSLRKYLLLKDYHEYNWYHIAPRNASSQNTDDANAVAIKYLVDRLIA
jgi:hypothetical protein